MGRRTSIEVRELVIKHFKDGKSQRKIGEILKISPSTVQHIIERYVQENRVVNKGRTAPNKIFSASDCRWIVRKVKEDPTLSAVKLAQEAEKYLNKKSSAETIRRILRESDFNGRSARKKPYISAKNKIARITFARDHVSKDETFWDTVIFTDESKFNLHGSDGRSYVWRQPNTQLQPKNMRGTVKHGGGHVMVWGAMSSSGVGNLVFIEGNMDKNMYLDILKENLVQSAEKLNIKDCFRLYQDNDPKHKSGIVQTWLIWNCPHVMQPPAQSPDINAIENLWSKLEREIRKHEIRCKDDLKKALLEEWGKIPPDYCRKLVRSLPRRLKSVLEQKGYPTKY